MQDFIIFCRKEIVMNWYKKAYVDGEWWITDTGEALYADGDRGDYNHEAYVFEQILGSYFDLDDPNTPDMYEFENMPEEELSQAGLSPEEIQVVYNQVDAREYAMKNWNWIRVADKYIQSWYLTSGILKNMANGLYDAYEADAFKNTFVISSMSNGKNYSPVPYEVIDSGSPRNLMQYLEFDPMNLRASMNWYKKAQGIEIIEQENQDDPRYVDYGGIGHDWYYGYEDDYESGNFNYVWVFIDGEVDVEIETEEIDSHSSVRRWDKLMSRWDSVYSGRYDSSSKAISVTKPSGGVAKYRGVPKSIQYALKQKFPEAKQMYVY